MLYPATVDVLAVQFRSTECCTTAVPVPLTGSFSVELDALLAMAIVSEAAPLDCGVNVTVNVALCPDAIVFGRVMPLIANSEVPGVRDVTVTLPPVAVSVAVKGFDEFTDTLPKLSEVGFTPSCPTDVPVPVSVNVRFATVALEVMTRLPFELPVLVGAKLMPKVKL